MRFQNKKVTLFALLFFPLFLFSQYLPSQKYTTADGLSNNAIRSLFLDRKNNLWIGTENGISHLENGQFTNLYKENGLTHNSCWDICQDSKGSMWFASYGGGVTKFDGKNFKTFTTKQGLPVDKTRKVFPYKDKIYVGTEYGISIIDINSGKIQTPKEVFPNFGVFIVTEIFAYKEQVYFTALNEGLFKIQNTESFPKVVPVESYKITYSAGVFQDKMYSSNKGFVDILKLDSQDVKIEKTFGESIIWEYAQDKRNQIFASAWGIFDSNGGLFQIENDKMLDVSELYGIDSKNLLNVVYDKINDVLFIGSKDKGLYQIQLDKVIDYNKFESKKIIDFEENTILHQNGLDFKFEKIQSKSISHTDFKHFQQQYIIKNKNLPKYSQGFFELNYEIASEDILFYEIVKHENSFWISSNIGIFEINKEAKIIAYVPIHTYKFGFTTDNKFYETNPYGGIHIYDDIYRLKVNSFSNVPTDIVRTINANGKTYFLSVFKGLFSFNDNDFTSYLKSSNFKEEKLKYIAKSNNGNLIVSSEFGDVFVIDDSKSFKIVRKISKDKIIGNSINFLESYKDFIFIGTEKGITIYKNGSIRWLDKEQGLLDCNFTTSEIINNTLFLGTNKGYYKLDLEKICKDQKSASKLEISSISINNIPISDKKFNWFKFDADEMVVDHDQNSFSIDFVPSGHAFPDKLKFRYRLSNTNSWSPYFEKPNVFLPYLSHGTHNLEIEVLDLNAGKSTVFSVLKIKISAPFWLAWWFILLLISLIFGSTFYFIIQSKRKAKEKALIQKRIAETKLEALLSQMNPHFTFNAMNAIQNYIINNDTLNSIHFIGEFSKLMRKTLENSSKPTIPLEEEIDYLKTYVSIENMRFNNLVAVEFRIDETVDTFTPVPTMLLQPFVENVFVHAFNASHSNPKLLISFEIENETTLLCKITDNGKGLSKTSKSLHKSKGILLAKERLTLLDQTAEEAILVKENIPNGVRVEIRLSF